MTYSFKLIVEPDGNRWHAYCPALVSAGAATWGYSLAEALRNIQDVARMVVDSLVEHGEGNGDAAWMHPLLAAADHVVIYESAASVKGYF